MAFEYNGVVYRDLEPQVRYDAEQVELLKQEVKKTNASNLENGIGENSIQQKYIKDGVDHSAQATGENSAAFGGLRFDYDPEKHRGDKTNTAAGNQSFVTGCGNYTAGDWSFVTGKDNTVYSNRAFVSGGANVSQAIDSGGNLLEEKTNVGRFNAIFGNNNTFKSSDASKESNLIAGGSNTVDTERSVVVGYNNNVAGHYDAVFGFKNVVNADYSLTGGQGHIVNGGYSLVAGSGNKVSGQFNIASGQDNENLGWNGAVIGRELVVGEGHTAQTVLGQYNDNKSNTVLEIGWGSSDNRKNVFEVLQDGRAKVKAAPIQDDDVVRKGDLTGPGGGKLYKHTVKLSHNHHNTYTDWLEYVEYRSNNTPITDRSIINGEYCYIHFTNADTGEEIMGLVNASIAYDNMIGLTGVAGSSQSSSAVNIYGLYEFENISDYVTEV